MTTLEKVTAMMPIVTPFTMPTDSTAKQTLYNLADARYKQDGVTLSENAETLAYCLIVAHYMLMQKGATGVTSEHLGQWSVTYADGTSAYLAEYSRMLKDAHLKRMARGDGIVKHNDKKCADYYGIDNTHQGCFYE